MAIMMLMNAYEKMHNRLMKQHHGACLFNELNSSVGRDLEIRFASDGTLRGEFAGGERYQGYDGMLHGGVIAALIDAGSVQCLWGHGIVAYTGRMNIRYRKPLKSDKSAQICSKISDVFLGKYYKIDTQISQSGVARIFGDACFCKIDSAEDI
jgi:acyl-coenzyme A thioesterase PaaI-like protein